ncbi:hypothetical protein M9H77_10734 [Catharanthus roseus]|uniref:Uncharacterized protein n=1 Tax=Catharanthus roseus TaxID=4058 RepID=A0ACC0BCI3_CATRO|nr:hypothetical protein M9H77_10734 [Catharanthus roseus]
MYMKFLIFRRLSSTLIQISAPNSFLHSKIKALVLQGDYLDALLSYAKGSSLPLYTSIFTFPSLLKSCASLSNLFYGKTIHSTILKMGLQFDPYITTSLINMYVKCGSFINAFRVFENMSRCDLLAQDVTIWNSMLDGFFKFGLIQHGMVHFCRMQLSGVKPDPYSLSILLGVFDGNFDIQSGKQIHGYIIRNLFQDDPYLMTALIEMYSNFRRPMDAWCVFDRLQDKKATIVVWNSMITAFYENGWLMNSLELYSLANYEGCKLASSTFSSVLVVCSRGEYAEFGRQVHCHVVKVGFEDEPYVCTSLLTMYAKCGLVKDAKEVFDSVTDKRVELWNSMISAYVGNSKEFDALDLYYQMQLSAVPSDSFTISDTLVSCSMLGLYDFGRAVHAETIKRPVQNNVAVQSSLLSMYSKCGNLEDAVKVFSRMDVKDMVAWGSMISAYSQNKKTEDALNLFKAMELEDMKPDPNIAASIITVCGELGSLYPVLCGHGFVIKRGLDSDPFVGTSLMNMYSRYGQPELVGNVFSDILPKNLVVWNCLISCYCQNGLSDLSISLLPQIMQQGLYPDSISITTVLMAISSVAALLKGKAIHGFQIRHNVPCDIQVENALIDMYMKCGALRYAQHLFSNNMPARNLVTWNTMIAGYGSHGYCLEAINLFNEMRTSGISPDDITFLSLISSCNHAGLINEGLSLFYLMRKYRIEPRMEHYINMVDLLGRAGCLDDAFGFVKDMPIEPDQGIWLSLLSASRLKHNVELGEFAAHNLLKIDPTKGSNYVQLLNLYVEAGFQEKAAKLRAWMKQRGLKKIPGCSWIEVKNKVDVFFSGDSSSPKTIEMHELLKNLRHNMERVEEEPLEAIELI